MLNLDMLGRSTKNRLSATGVGTGDSFEAILKEANEITKLKLTLSKSAYPGSDHTPFYMKKIPIIFFFTGVHSDYHAPSDTVDKINFPVLVKTSKVVYLTVAKLAAQEKRPTFVSVRTPGRRGQRGPRMGIVPDFGFEGKGARISAVSPDTPAAKAGLAEGDVIVEFNGKAVDGMTALFGLLSKVKPGQKVKIAYLRKGKRTETEIQFEKRR
jgi:membrane-associated protease RseP (regulator of RpoE activity)